MLPRLSLPLLLCTALAAQQTTASPAVTANRFVPADSCVVLRMAAPAKWRQQFQKTQVMKLLQAKTLAPMLEQLHAVDQQMLEQLRSSGEFDADLVEKLLNDYTGDVVFSMQVDWKDVASAIEGQRAPAMSFVLALAPGAGLDLAALAAALGKLAEQKSEDGSPLRDATVGDLHLRVNGDDEHATASVPVLLDGHLVMVVTVGQEFETTATRLLGTTGRLEGELAAAPFHLQARLGSALDTLLPVLGERADQDGAPFDVVAVLHQIGLGALDQFSMSIGADDQHATANVDLTLRDGEAGLFGAMLVDEPPKLLRLVPPANDWFSVGHVDWNALYGTVTKLWDDLADVVPMSREDAEGAFAEAMKVRLHEDLIAHLGTEILSLQSHDPDAAAEDVEDDPLSAMGSGCFVLALRDGKAFGESLEKALRARGLHASRKTEEYGDQKVYRLRLAGVLEVEYAVTDDVLLIAPGKGEAGRRNLRAVLDARKQGAAGDQPTVLQAHLKELPPGFSGVSVSPIAAMLDGIRGAMRAAAASGQVPVNLDAIDGVLTGLAGDVQRLGIEHMISTTYTTKRSFKTRLRW